MKIAPLVLAAVTLAPAPYAFAHTHDESCSAVHMTSCSPPVRWAARHDVGDARLAITTEDRDATLLLTDEVVAVQLSDRALHRVQRKLQQQLDEDDDNALAQSIKAVVFAGVRTLLDHSAECRIRDLRDASYEDGRLVFTTESGKCVFADLDVNDGDVMQGFKERDARAFVEEFRRVKAHQR